MGCCEDNKDCYCGCGTRKNRILWGLVLAFFLASSAFQAGRNVLYSRCEVCDLDGSDCQSLFSYQFTFGTTVYPEQSCSGDDCLLAGTNDKKIEGCSVTLIQILSWIGSVFSILFWVPCCVMCCCSRKPDYMLQQRAPQAPVTAPPPQYLAAQPVPATMQPYPSPPDPASGPASYYSDSTPAAPAPKPIPVYEPPV